MPWTYINEHNKVLFGRFGLFFNRSLYKSIIIIQYNANIMKRTVVISDPRVLKYIDLYKSTHLLAGTYKDDSDVVEELLLQMSSLQVMDGGMYNGYPEKLKEECIIEIENK